MGRAARVNRARRMLAVLESAPRAFSREEIFEKAGRHFLTNNAASELRAQGYNVVQSREPTPDGEVIYLYRLVGVLPAEPAGDAPVGSAGRTSSQASSARCSPSCRLDAGPDTVATGTGRLSEFDRIVGASYVTAILWPWFNDESEIESYWLADDGAELVDEDLSDELAEQQRVLFLSEAA